MLFYSFTELSYSLYRIARLLLLLHLLLLQTPPTYSHYFIFPSSNITTYFPPTYFNPSLLSFLFLPPLYYPYLLFHSIYYCFNYSYYSFPLLILLCYPHTFFTPPSPLPPSRRTLLTLSSPFAYIP